MYSHYRVVVWQRNVCVQEYFLTVKLLTRRQVHAQQLLCFCRSVERAILLGTSRRTCAQEYMLI